MDEAEAPLSPLEDVFEHEPPADSPYALEAMDDELEAKHGAPREHSRNRRLRRPRTDREATPLRDPSADGSGSRGPG